MANGRVRNVFNKYLTAFLSIFQTKILILFSNKLVFSTATLKSYIYIFVYFFAGSSVLPTPFAYVAHFAFLKDGFEPRELP